MRSGCAFELHQAHRITANQPKQIYLHNDDMALQCYRARDSRNRYALRCRARPTQARREQLLDWLVGLIAARSIQISSAGAIVDAARQPKPQVQRRSLGNSHDQSRSHLLVVVVAALINAAPVAVLDVSRLLELIISWLRRHSGMAKRNPR